MESLTSSRSSDTLAQNLSLGFWCMPCSCISASCVMFEVPGCTYLTFSPSNSTSHGIGNQGNQNILSSAAFLSQACLSLLFL